MAGGLEKLSARIHAFPAEFAAAIAGEANDVMSAAALDGAKKSYMGIALKVRVTTQANSSGATVTVAPSPAGPWVIGEVGSYKKPNGWRIPNPGGGILHWNDGQEVFRAWVTHPPIRGERAWTDARARMTAAFTALMAEIGDEVWGGVIGA